MLSGCATEPMPSPQAGPDVGRSLGQPLRDLSLIREAAPDVLLRAASGPYALEGVADCEGARAEVERLDLALGPDLEPAPEAGARASGVSVGGLAADLVGGAVGLPFRGVVRRVTGAQAREAALRAAVLAGMVRRGFLKGRLERMACAPRASTS